MKEIEWACDQYNKTRVYVQYIRITGNKLIFIVHYVATRCGRKINIYTGNSNLGACHVILFFAAVPLYIKKEWAIKFLQEFGNVLN